MSAIPLLLAMFIAAIVTERILVPYYREQLAERDRHIATLNRRIARLERAAAVREVHQ